MTFFISRHSMIKRCTRRSGNCMDAEYYNGLKGNWTQNAHPHTHREEKTVSGVGVWLTAEITVGLETVNSIFGGMQLEET